ncbi:MAG: hypothetical protein HDT43_01855 [Ruminococcaceae bacterium]|nr:hypothetical protein [Oscillospiraceae bacterium]
MSEILSEFEKDVQDFLDEHKGETSFKAATSITNGFMRFYQSHDKAIENYTAADFEEYFRGTCKTVAAFRTTKMYLLKVFEGCGHYRPAEVLKNVNRTVKMNYLRSFEELDAGIEKVRNEKHPFMADQPEPEECDELTMGQVILYLLWLGVPKNSLLELPLDAIDLENKCIKAGKIYPFDDIPKVEKVLTQYKNATGYISYTTRRGKLVPVKKEYRGDTLIRARTIPTGTSMNIKTTFDRIYTNFKFAGSYLNVFRSGQFSRGYDRIKHGQLPDFSSSQSIWDYFRVWLETDAEISLFRQDWAEYVKVRQKEDFG